MTESMSYINLHSSCLNSRANDTLPLPLLHILRVQRLGLQLQVYTCKDQVPGVPATSAAFKLPHTLSLFGTTCLQPFPAQPGPHFSVTVPPNQHMSLAIA